MIRVVDNGLAWNGWLKQMDSFDFYHSYDYHKIISEKENVGTPILLTYEDEQNVKIGIPFVKRRIDDFYFDLTSVHGYLGPVSTGLSSDFENSLFKKEFVEWLQQENIVSVFSKLNPFIKGQHEIVDSLGSLKKVGEIIYFDQTEDDTIQKSKYNRNTRQKIRQLRNTCTIEIASEEDQICEFMRLYHQSMDKLNAKQIFYFDQTYFRTLLKSSLIDSKILLARDSETNDIMGGVFYARTGAIAHVELACTGEDHLKKSPVRILFDECRLMNKNDGLKYLNLGGGSGGRDGSLMRFKSSFTDHYKDLNIWSYVAIPDIYDELLSDRQKKSDTNFFPKYRFIE
ncbi:GNAT family N-acetyltransferase [Flagellimonas sp. 2504JD1-5]